MRPSMALTSHYSSRCLPEYVNPMGMIFPLMNIILNYIIFIAFMKGYHAICLMTLTSLLATCVLMYPIKINRRSFYQFRM